MIWTCIKVNSAAKTRLDSMTFDNSTRDISQMTLTSYSNTILFHFTGGIFSLVKLVGTKGTLWILQRKSVFAKRCTSCSLHAHVYKSYKFLVNITKILNRRFEMKTIFHIAIWPVPTPLWNYYKVYLDCKFTFICLFYYFYLINRSVVSFSDSNVFLYSWY